MARGGQASNKSHPYNLIQLSYAALNNNRSYAANKKPRVREGGDT
jgi:hypothetical protein